jgi:hypothetical protein
MYMWRIYKQGVNRNDRKYREHKKMNKVFRKKYILEQMDDLIDELTVLLCIKMKE